MSVADKKSAKKGKLIEAAFELFTLKGINPTAIDEVVKRAGVAKGTFYLYFKDKYDLLEQMIVLKCDELVKNVLTEIKPMTDDCEVLPSDKIITFIDKVMDGLIENKSLAVLVLKDMAAFRKLWTIDEGKESGNTYKTLINIFIEGGCDEDSAPKTMYTVFIAAASVCCDSILYQSPYTPDEIKPQIHQMIKSLIK